MIKFSIDYDGPLMLFQGEQCHILKALDNNLFCEHPDLCLLEPVLLQVAQLGINFV